jgi:hypothetical protein
MYRSISIALLTAGVLLTGLAHADEATVGCGEVCDSEMIQCLSKCPPPPANQSQDAPYEIECQNECAKKIFHPCLDKCKHFKHKPPPKPNVNQ